jgi:hypothetical protein
MVKFLATQADGRRLLGLGLSRANCNRLLAGEPIAFKLEAIPGLEAKGDVIIFAGETEQDMAQRFSLGIPIVGRNEEKTSEEGQ